MKKYKILTFGGAGGNIVRTLVSNNQFLYEKQGDILYHFNTDAQAIKNHKSLKNKYLIGNSGFVCPPSIEYAKILFDGDRKLFDELTNDDSPYLLIGAFSGYIGSVFLIKMSELLAKKRKKFVVVGSTPFRIEASERFQHSDDVIEILKDITDNIIVLSCDKLQTSLGENITVGTIFTMADYYVIEAISSVLDLDNWSIDKQVRNILRNDDEISTAITKVRKYLNEN
ncbi:MAG: hypothetical protein LBI15_09500 [Dysgonamonadaceae bacterium]|jgi:cell division GTPase FtsZ|nr:hypothetical protein [Dysgonamonadaceae bacterium]